MQADENRHRREIDPQHFGVVKQGGEDFMKVLMYGAAMLVGIGRLISGRAVGLYVRRPTFQGIESDLGDEQGTIVRIDF